MKAFLKWLGVGVTALLCLAMLCAAFVFAASNRQINRRYETGASWIRVPRDSESLARGEHLVRTITKCTDCHGEDLGGTQMIDDKAFARIAAPNITMGVGGRGRLYSDLELARVIQHGVKRDGRAAVIMPAEAYINLSDDDLASIVEYVRSVPRVDRSWPPPEYGPVSRGLMAFGKLPVFAAAYIDHGRGSVLPPPRPDTTAEYGRYLTLIGGCQGCHNPSLSGGPIPGGDPSSPPAANLTPTGIGNHSEADFARVLHQGIGLDGRTIDNQYMPWKSSGHMTDAEIHAVWLYLRTVPAKATGQR